MKLTATQQQELISAVLGDLQDKFLAATKDLAIEDHERLAEILAVNLMATIVIQTSKKDINCDAADIGNEIAEAIGEKFKFLMGKTTVAISHQMDGIVADLKKQVDA